MNIVFHVIILDKASPWLGAGWWETACCSFYIPQDSQRDSMDANDLFRPWIFCKSKRKKVSVLILAILPATHAAHSSQWHCANVLHILSPHCYPQAWYFLMSLSPYYAQSLSLRSDGLTIALNQIALQYLHYGSQFSNLKQLCLSKSDLGF